jgi:ATP-dependent RNA helicase SUPV3L1/SUV3
MVGCSGEDFASILRALGFRRERRKLDGGNGAGKLPELSAALTDTAASLVTEAPVIAGDQNRSVGDDTAAEEIRVDEVWRPGKRKDTRREHRTASKAPSQGRSPSAKPQRRTAPVRAKRERSIAIEHSPFAALKELRESLVARRRPDGS